MKTRRFDFNWKSLQLQLSLTVDGSVPGRQNYSADTGEYTPDYTLTPFVLQPVVGVLDKDGVLTAGSVNHALANVSWHEVKGGVSTLISADNAGYEVTASGGNAGRIKVKRNADPEVPVTLEFRAEYADSRTGQVFTVRGSYLLTCDSASDTVRMELDAAGQTLYNPLSDARTQTVRATVWQGAVIMPAGKYTLEWEVLDEGGVWRRAGTDDVMDYDITVDGNGTVTVDRWLMGTEMSLRCRADLAAGGSPKAGPQAQVTFVRRIPKYESDIAEAPYNIPGGILSIKPSAAIRTTKGGVEDPERELLPLWYMATNKASGSLSYSVVAHGISPVIPTARMDGVYGAVLGLDVIDRGYAGAFTDAADNAVLRDADGSILIIH